LSPEVLILAPRQELARDFHFTLTTLRVRLLAADGETPMAHAAVQVEGSGNFASQTTDSDGWIVLSSPPPGPFP
jgi:hypothetical protein